MIYVFNLYFKHEFHLLENTQNDASKDLDFLITNLITAPRRAVESGKKSGKKSKKSSTSTSKSGKKSSESKNENSADPSSFPSLHSSTRPTVGFNPINYPTTAPSTTFPSNFSFADDTFKLTNSSRIDDIMMFYD